MARNNKSVDETVGATSRRKNKNRKKSRSPIKEKAQAEYILKVDDQF